MKYFRADLHVHSRFSRATSGRLNIRNLAAWSMIKGLSVMSTGDFTHPAWRDELRRDLVYDDNSGLYRVREKTPLETEIPGFLARTASASRNSSSKRKSAPSTRKAVPYAKYTTS